MFSSAAQFCYALHYREVISQRLTKEQKETVAKRISDLTLKAPIWQDPDKNWIDKFPELVGCVNATLSGLYLCTILREIVDELASITNTKNL